MDVTPLPRISSSQNPRRISRGKTLFLGKFQTIWGRNTITFGTFRREGHLQKLGCKTNKGLFTKWIPYCPRLSPHRQPSPALLKGSPPDPCTQVTPKKKKGKKAKFRHDRGVNCYHHDGSPGKKPVTRNSAHVFFLLGWKQPSPCSQTG